MKYPVHMVYFKMSSVTNIIMLEMMMVDLGKVHNTYWYEIMK